MTASLFDSAPYRGILRDRDIAPLFTDTAVLRAMLLVFGATALAQAKQGNVPEISAKAIQRAALEVQVDPAALSADMTTDTNLTAALVTHFGSEMKAPEHAKWIAHATSSTAVIDSALALRLRQVIGIFETRLADHPAHLAALTALRPVVQQAYHDDADTRAGIAAGLGLTPAFLPAATALAQFADWASTAANDIATTPLTRDLAMLITAQMPLMGPNGTDMTRALTLPQICLALGCILTQN